MQRTILSSILNEENGRGIPWLNFCFTLQLHIFHVYHIFCISKTGYTNLKKLYTSLSNAFFQPLNGKYSNIYVGFAVFIIYLCFL